MMMLMSESPKKEEEKKPTLKELMTGKVLDGYVEAARVKPLTEFALSPLEKRRKELLKQAEELKKRLQSG